MTISCSHKFVSMCNPSIFSQVRELQHAKILSMHEEGLESEGESQTSPTFTCRLPIHGSPKEKPIRYLVIACDPRKYTTETGTKYIVRSYPDLTCNESFLTACPASLACHSVLNSTTLKQSHNGSTGGMNSSCQGTLMLVKLHRTICSVVSIHYLGKSPHHLNNSVSLCCSKPIKR